jgi:hypothetical protein
VKRLPYALAEYPAFRVDRVARCARGHDTVVFAWDGKDAPWPRPPHVVATENDFDWSHRSAAARPSRVLPWRRSYVSVCTTCGERIAD